MKKTSYLLLLTFLFSASISFARVQYSSELEVDGEELAIGNFLNWSTSFEENSEVFFVEKSIDNGQSFEVIGQVTAAGNTQKGKEYRFLDLNVIDGTVWYRLRQVDLDKTESFSNVAEIEKLINNNLVIKDINTIEVKKEFVVQLESFVNGPLEYVLTDNQGMIVMENGQNLINGLNTIIIDLENEPKGNYKLTMRLENEIEILNFMKIGDEIMEKPNVASKNTKRE